jgi:hypothetical protein
MTLRSTVTTDDALTEFPELQRLVDLRTAGWRFLPVTTDGEMVALRGIRTWPDDWVDAIVVRFTTEAAGFRGHSSRGVVWHREGHLVDVVDGLLTLPTPSEQTASSLVLHAAPGLWMP